MNSSIHLHTDFKLDDDLNDIAGEFAGTAIHRIGFDFDGETGLDTLADVYGYRVFRAYRWQEEGKLKWQRLVLRFARDAYVVAFGCGTGRIIASTAEKAEALLAELTELLDEEPAEKEPCFYMLRYDMGSFTADPIENLPDAVDDEFLRLARCVALRVQHRDVEDDLAGIDGQVHPTQRLRRAKTFTDTLHPQPVHRRVGGI